MILVLRSMQGRNDGRTLPAFRKLGDPMIDFFANMCGERHSTIARCRIFSPVFAHRSISPNTISCVPMTATTSASIWPATISFIDDR